MSTDSFASLARKVQRVQVELSDEGLMRDVGMAGKRIGNQELRADAGGDLSLSNWRRKRQINMGVRFDTIGPGELEIGPSKRGRGPARVLTDGRKAGTSRKGRPVSASRGKGSWDRASSGMERELPRVAQKHTSKVLRKHFG